MKTNEETFIAKYDESERTGYDIRDMYDDYIANENDDVLNEDGVIMDFIEFSEKSEDSNTFYEWESGMWDIMWQDYYNCTVYEADKILAKGEYCRVSGSAGLWDGRKYVDTIIKETELKDIISNYMNVDMLTVIVYEDRVEVENCHHDGTNYYTLTPFNFEDCKKSELLEMINKEEYEWYGDKLYKATKDDLVNYLREKN